MEVVGRSVSADTQGLVVYARGIRAGLQKLRNEATVLFFLVEIKRTMNLHIGHVAANKTSHWWLI